MSSFSFNPPLPFIDLQAQKALIRQNVLAGIERVVDHGGYIMGPEVATLEKDLAAFCGAKHVLSCANGTDALGLVLMAKKLQAGQAVLCPSFTFAATAEVVAWFGATPIFVDVSEDTFNIDLKSLEAGLHTAREQGLKPVGVIAVDLFGLPADYDAIETFCKAHSLFLLSDAAQSFGASYKGRKVGTIGAATATSFFPAKPLGCYGDGGAVFTDDPDMMKELISLRVHGMGADRYDNVRIGMNARLDTIQCAVLIEKLKVFPAEIKARDAAARRYNEGLRDLVAVPHVPEGLTSVWAQYTLRLKENVRDTFAARLKERGVPTAVYYPKPLHQQTAYKHYPVAGGRLPVSDTIAKRVISLPMHGYLAEDTQARIIEIARDALKGLHNA